MRCGFQGFGMTFVLHAAAGVANEYLEKDESRAARRILHPVTPRLAVLKTKHAR
jgi:hypothetical protein